MLWGCTGRWLFLPAFQCFLSTYHQLPPETHAHCHSCLRSGQGPAIQHSDGRQQESMIHSSVCFTHNIQCCNEVGTTAMIHIAHTLNASLHNFPETNTEKGKIFHTDSRLVLHLQINNVQFPSLKCTSLF